MGYVLVGIDGSDAARDALAWAGHAAQRFELPLRVIHDYVQDISTQTGPAALRGATIHSGDPEPGGPRRHDQSRDVATRIIHEGWAGRPQKLPSSSLSTGTRVTSCCATPETRRWSSSARVVSAASVGGYSIRSRSGWRTG
jgi:hypothetical protein